MNFTTTYFGRKPANKLEAHLLETAQAWCKLDAIFWLDGEETRQVHTLQDFLTAQRREKELYCQDHPRSRPDSISIALHTAAHPRVWADFDSICIRPTAGDPSTTFLIRETPNQQ